MRRPSGTFDVSYEQDMMVFRTRAQRLGMLGILALSLVIPLFVDEYWLLFINTVAVTIIALQGLNILAGWCGQISIGHSAFMAVGAYGSAILAGQCNFPFWVTLPCAGIGAGLVGMLFGLPSLRIKGFLFGPGHNSGSVHHHVCHPNAFRRNHRWPDCFAGSARQSWGFYIQNRNRFLLPDFSLYGRHDPCDQELDAQSCGKSIRCRPGQ